MTQPHLTDIPAELGKLTSLTEFTSTGINSAVPSLRSWASSRTWTTLYLNDNALTGPIPAELGDALTNLTTLYLHNQLSGPIPAELQTLAAMQDLDFSLMA